MVAAGGLDGGLADAAVTYTAIHQEVDSLPASAPGVTDAASASLDVNGSGPAPASEGHAGELSAGSPPACLGRHARLPATLLCGAAVAVALWLRQQAGAGPTVRPAVGVERSAQGLVEAADDPELLQEASEFQAVTSGSCATIGMAPITDQRECSVAAEALGIVDTTMHVSAEKDRPEGCYILKATGSEPTETLWISIDTENQGNGAMRVDKYLLTPICASEEKGIQHKSGKKRSGASSPKTPARLPAPRPAPVPPPTPPESTADTTFAGLASALTAAPTPAHRDNASEFKEPSSKPFELGCLKWQVDGCHTLETAEDCRAGRDGRSIDVWLDNQARIHGQPCVWCGGGPCTLSGKTKCEPYEYVVKSEGFDAGRAAADFSVASCPELEDVQVPSLFCFALMLPFGYEPQLLQAQLAKTVGIFACEDYLVLSNITYDLSSNGQQRVLTMPIPGTLEVEYGGKWYTALNTDIFIRVWNAVSMVGRYELHDWTVKADPDSVFFPDRLQQLLLRKPMRDIPSGNHSMGASCGYCQKDSQKPYEERESCAWRVQSLQREGKSCVEARKLAARSPPTDCGCDCGDLACNLSSSSMYLNNCEFELHGPIEVLSRDAVATYISRIYDCEDIRQEPFGEDKYLRRCLNRLGVRKENQFSLLDEIACGQHPVVCTSPHVSFHPFKDIEAYFQCWGEATKFGLWP